MAEVIMPKMGDAIKEGTLLKWLKAVGDPVAEGDALAEIETDKVTLEIEAQEDGFLTNIIVEEGAVVPIGEAVAMIGAEDQIGKEAPAAAPAAAPEEAPAEAAPAVEAATQPQAAPEAEPEEQVADQGPAERVRASPLV